MKKREVLLKDIRSLFRGGFKAAERRGREFTSVNDRLNHGCRNLPEENEIENEIFEVYFEAGSRQPSEEDGSLLP